MFERLIELFRPVILRENLQADGTLERAESESDNLLINRQIDITKIQSELALKGIHCNSVSLVDNGCSTDDIDVVKLYRLLAAERGLEVVEIHIGADCDFVEKAQQIRELDPSKALIVLVEDLQINNNDTSLNARRFFGLLRSIIQESRKVVFYCPREVLDNNYSHGIGEPGINLAFIGSRRKKKS